MAYNYDKMSVDELKQLALQKDKRGCATSAALRAQQILHDRYHWDEVDMRDERDNEDGTDSIH